MRTTVTLDPDVEALIREVMRERQISFKEALNQAVRVGIRSQHRKSHQRFQQKTYRIEHGAELCSSDTDFARFPGLRWRGPLAAPRPRR